MHNPYLLDRPAIVSTSGGRMLKMVQEQQVLPFCEDDPDDLATYCRCTD